MKFIKTYLFVNRIDLPLGLEFIGRAGLVEQRRMSCGSVPKERNEPEILRPEAKPPAEQVICVISGRRGG